jgi:hypothetical protein
MIKLENKRELFWDDYLVDTEKTTAKLTLNRPVKKNLVIELDKPWEGDCFSYSDIVRVGDGYRMYYITGMSGTVGNIEPITGMQFGFLCFLESDDGLNWTRPSLGICEFDGGTDNNIIMCRSADDQLDNFFVFYDENPNCPPEEKFKATSEYERNDREFPADRELWCYTSPDGIRFKKAWLMTDGSVPNGGIFDSMNVAYWDAQKGKYVAFVRGLHDGPGKGTANGLRDIRYMESDDFKSWTNPVLLDFGEQDDYELYTNNISRYYRAPHIMIGFPTRYTERRCWTRNMDFLGGAENAALRREYMKTIERLGFTLTDGLFMTSRDGTHWSRFDEAIFTADAENTYNWVYGDGYPTYGILETPRDYPHITNEISMFMKEGHRGRQPARLYRYTIRLDGFASYRSDYKPQTLCTKPFTFEGGRLELNFKTSARGYIYVSILDYYGKPIEGFTSYEIFGDAYDRPVYFDEGAKLSNLAGTPIRLQFTMSDADIYSFIIREE